MDSRTFVEVLTQIELGQADLARLLGVTARAVNLWAKDSRAVPGPVEAYLRLFQMLPTSLKSIELGRLKEKGTNMRDGIFGLTFQGPTGGGLGVLIFDEGRVYGTDSEGARFDGDYIFHEEDARADVSVKATFPRDVLTVFGVANPYEWAIDLRASFYPNQDTAALTVHSSLGTPLEAHMKFLRPLPHAA